jgi:hypothetical protein
MKLNFKIMKVFLYDLKLSSLLKTKNRIYKESKSFYKFLFIQQWLKKMCDLLGQL